jgi:ferric-dicitrate binding protein FerR (iron transport regulator)
MHYKLFSTEDFVQDDFFQQWVFFPNEESTRYWEDFLLHYPMQRIKIEDAREFLLAMNFERHVPETVLQRMHYNINAAIDRVESRNTFLPSVKPPARSRIFRTSFSIAASLILAVLFIGYFVIEKGIPFTALQATNLEEQKTPQGKQRHIILADGTRIWLNAGSEIKYPKDFTAKEKREVYLDGEAFFEVSENRQKPFIVHTSNLTIEVLGTAFNVRSYAADSVVETTLVRGKVSIAPDSEGEDPGHIVTLLPNQQALFSKESKVIALEETVNTESYVGWKNGWMIFDDKPFSFIKETLERWYDVTITMEDEKSLSCTFSAKFKDKTLQEVLEIFENTESINYRIDGDQVFISGRLCQYGSSN